MWKFQALDFKKEEQRRKTEEKEKERKEKQRTKKLNAGREAAAVYLGAKRPGRHNCSSLHERTEQPPQGPENSKKSFGKSGPHFFGI